MPLTREALEEVASQMLGEVYAQVDDLSDDTVDTINKHCPGGPEHDALVALAEELAATLKSAVEQRHADWMAEATTTVCPHEPAHTWGTCPSILR